MLPWRNGDEEEGPSSTVVRQSGGLDVRNSQRVWKQLYSSVTVFVHFDALICSSVPLFRYQVLRIAASKRFLLAEASGKGCADEYGHCWILDIIRSGDVPENARFRAGYAQGQACSHSGNDTGSIADCFTPA